MQWHLNRILWRPRNHSQVTSSEINIHKEYSRASITCSCFIHNLSPCITIHIYRDNYIYMCIEKSWGCIHTHRTHSHTEVQPIPEGSSCHFSPSQQLLYVSIQRSTHSDPLCVWFWLTDRWWLRGMWLLSHLRVLVGGGKRWKIWGRGGVGEMK